MAFWLKSRHVLVNSHSRINATDSHSSFTYDINLQESLGTGAPFTRVVMESAIIPKSFYSVQTGHNTTTLKEGLLTATVTLAIGTYSLRSWRAALSAALTVASPNLWTYTVTSPSTANQPDTGKLTYTVTGSGGVQPSLLFVENLHEACGFGPNTTNTFVGGVLTSTDVIKLSNEDALLIHSDICAGGGADNYSDVLATVFTAANSYFGSVVLYASDLEARSRPLANASGGTYRFTLTNEENEIVDLNGQNVVYSLIVYRPFDLSGLLINFASVVLQAIRNLVRTQPSASSVLEETV